MYWRICFWLLLLAIGFVLGLLYGHYSELHIDASITAGQLLQSVVTIVIAFIVSKWWRDAHFRDDTAKDLLGEGLGRADEHSEEIQKSVVNLYALPWNADVFAEIITVHRNLSNCISEIDATARDVFGSSPCVELRAAAFDLKRATTSTSPGIPLGRSNVEHSLARFSLALGRTQAQILRL